MSPRRTGRILPEALQGLDIFTDTRFTDLAFTGELAIDLYRHTVLP